ncbi:MAG: flagellar hook-length control protein FliK [Nitrospirae bacterium]|nr:flagellar hook-length control protein FliK [Nitrospirota bacterium]
MNIFPSIEQAVTEAPKPQASDTQANLPEKNGVFDLMLAQLMQGIMSLPGEDALSAGTQPEQPEDGMAGPAASKDAGKEMASMPTLTALQRVQSAFAAAIADLPEVVKTAKETPGSESRGDAGTVPQPVPSSSASAQTASAAEDQRPELTVKPDSMKSVPKSDVSAQLPADAVQKAPAAEAQQPAIIRETILAEVGSSKDSADLPGAQKRQEKNSLPETLPVNSAEPQGVSRFHAAPAGSPAEAHHLSENMHVEGNRFVITRMDGTSIEISLQPEGLGKLDIGLVLDKGVVNAQIQASSAAGKDLVEKHMSEIVNALAQEGIAIGGFSVSLRDGRSDFSWSQGQNQGHQIQGETVMTKEYINQPRPLIGQGKVSIFI